MIGGWRPLVPEILDQTDRVGRKIVDSAVTPSEKIQLTLIEFHYALSNEPKMNIVRSPQAPQRVARKRKVPQILTISCNNSGTVQIGCQLLLITNRKSHMGFRLVPISMTLGDIECRNSLYFAFFFTEFDRFSGRL